MNSTTMFRGRLSGARLAVLALGALLLTPGCVRAQAHERPRVAPPDAIIELWEQHWTLAADGATTYEERQHVRLLQERAYAEYGDYRISYTDGRDQLEIVTARTKMADGKYVEPAAYSHVIVAPSGGAGWPAYGGLRQHVLVMPGLEPNCVVELAYKISSPPGARGVLAADVRLDSRYPVLRRVLTITQPATARLQLATDNFTAEQAAVVKAALDGGAERKLEFKDLAANPDEPHCTAWTARCPRIAFAVTSADAKPWLVQRLAQIDAAAAPAESVVKLATEWTKDKDGDLEKLRALQEKLAAAFNFVDLPVDWRPASLRSAAEVLASNYGMPEEAAAALFALARTAKLPVSLAAVSSTALWRPGAAQAAMIERYVVLLGAAEKPDKCAVFDAQRGRLAPSELVDKVLLTGAGDKPLPFAAPGPARLDIDGRVKIGDDGGWTGDFDLHLAGPLAGTEGLRSADAQKARLAGLIGRVLPDASIESFALQTLGDGEVRATAKVKSSKPLEKLDGAWRLTLPQDDPGLAEAGLPLAYAERRLPVHVATPLAAEVTLKLEWPEKWRVEATPQAVALVRNAHGAIGQAVQAEKATLRLRRTCELGAGEVPAEAFLQLRPAANRLRGEAARTLLLKP